MFKFESRLTPEMVAAYSASGDWQDQTFTDILLERARTIPDREVLSDGRRRVTYRQLAELVDRVGAKLQTLGIGKGDVVTIQLPNWVEFAACFFALDRIGAIATQINPGFRGSEVGYIVGFTEAVAYICPKSFRDFDYVPMIRELRSGLPALKHILVVDADEGKDTVSLKGVFDGSETLPAVKPVKTDPNEIYRMAFTSGTTGNPKAVAHTHNTTISACHYINRDFQFDANEVPLIYLPLGLNWGYITLVQTVLAGARAVLMDRFSGEAALKLIEKERVTYIPTAPASVIAMLNVANCFETYDLSSLRIVVSGGASCPVETIREYRKRMKGNFLELYGMLETGYHTYTRLTDDPEQVAGTVGTLVRPMGLRLLDIAGNDVPPGEEGEIACFGPSVHVGYQKNPTANQESFTPEGWFRTGDMGQMAGNNLMIVGRTKEMVNRGGQKYHPREIEEILYTNPKIIHAAVVGIPDPRLGEMNCLCVIPKPGETVTLDEFVGMLKGKVATYKLPETLEIVDDLPFTPTGKLQRHELVKRIVARRSAARAH